MKSGIYRIKCSTSGKSYIGSALNLSDRMVRHRYLLNAGRHHSVRLQRAWDKYGAEAFEFSVIEYTDDLLVREQAYLDAEKTYQRGMGYNVHPAARNSTGVKRSPETREKMSAWQRGRKLPVETRAKLSAARKAMVGWKHSPETRAKMSESAKNRKKLA